MQVTDAHVERVLHFIYLGLQKHFTTGMPWPETLPIDYPGLSVLARSAQTLTGEAIANNTLLLDAARRLDSCIACPAFYDCPKERCDGIVWCKEYNLGESHGFALRRQNLSRSEHKDRILEYFVPQEKD